MDTVPLPTRVLRIDSRYRRAARDDRREGAQVQEQEQRRSHEATGQPLLIREQKGRTVMGQAHRKFHRRQAQATSNVKTVNVEVVATLDNSGHVIGQVTATTPLVEPTVATAAAQVPVLPSVPAVPPFPSDLTVPAYPWPSGVPTVQVADTITPSAAVTTPTVPSVFPSTSGRNATTSSFTSSTSSSQNSTSSSSSTSSKSSSTSSHASTTHTSSSFASSSSSAGSSTGTWFVASTSGGGYFGPEQTGASTSVPTPATTTAAAAASSSPLDTPQVVGTVFGSLAGVALIAAILLFLIRRHKRSQNGGALQLSGDDQTDIDQPMTQRTARTSFITPAFLHRFSGASRSTAESSGTGERSFQRVSGRKLPSAWSEGMTSDQIAAAARGETTLSGSSFYHDEKGFCGGPGAVTSKDFGRDSGLEKEIGGGSQSGAIGTEERFRPSPARTPVIYHPDDAPWGTNHSGGGTLSPPLTPNLEPRGTLGRSQPSHDGSRSSRFTENV